MAACSTTRHDPMIYELGSPGRIRADRPAVPLARPGPPGPRLFKAEKLPGPAGPGSDPIPGT
eukprot:576734-Hanusia_phi.AAC.1